MRATGKGFNLFSPSALMAAVEPDAVLCRGLGGLPRSTSTTRRVYQGLGDPASHPLPAARCPHDSLPRLSQLSRISRFCMQFLARPKILRECGSVLFLSLPRENDISLCNFTLRYCVSSDICEYVAFSNFESLYFISHYLESRICYNKNVIDSNLIFSTTF